MFSTEINTVIKMANYYNLKIKINSNKKESLVNFKINFNNINEKKSIITYFKLYCDTFIEKEEPKNKYYFMLENEEMVTNTKLNNIFNVIIEKIESSENIY